MARTPYINTRAANSWKKQQLTLLAIV